MNSRNLGEQILFGSRPVGHWFFKKRPQISGFLHLTVLLKFICSCGVGSSFKAKTKNLDNHKDSCVVQNF